MRTIAELYQYLCTIVPLHLQADFDNSGFLVGNQKNIVAKVIVCLDVTSEVVEEAIIKKADLIISHHPIIWNKLSSITEDNITGKKIISLAKNDISVISMHTNYDKAEQGVNDILLEILGAEPCDVLDQEGYGRIGELKDSSSFSLFLDHCLNALNSNGLRYHQANNFVKRIAVLGGAGGFCTEQAYHCGCDTFITADIKYDQLLLAKELGINIIDGDHYCTEYPAMIRLKDRLTEHFPDIYFEMSESNLQTAQFITRD